MQLSYNRPPFRRQDVRHQPKPQAWDRIRGQVAREHRLITAADPRSPRIKPSVGLVGWVLR